MKNLEEAIAGKIRRWPKGSSRGGQFAPKRGGRPGEATSKAGKKVHNLAKRTTNLSAKELRTKYRIAVAGDKSGNLANRLKKSIERAADLCKQSPPICKGNLGISRAKMPQVAPGVMDKFIDSYKKSGVKVTKESVPVGTLKASQKEINGVKVMGMLGNFKKGKFPNIRDAIIVSKDGYVVDGHHRWATLLVSSPKEKMNVVRVDVGIRKLLKDANSFDGVVQRSFKEQYLWEIAFVQARRRGAQLL